MKMPSATRLAVYGPGGLDFLNTVRAHLKDVGMDRMVARALCNYFYRGLLETDWVYHPEKAFEYLRSRCPEDGRVEFRRHHQKKLFGETNCVIIALSERGD